VASALARGRGGGGGGEEAAGGGSARGGGARRRVRGDGKGQGRVGARLRGAARPRKRGGWARAHVGASCGATARPRAARRRRRRLKTPHLVAALDELDRHVLARLLVARELHEAERAAVEVPDLRGCMWSRGKSWGGGGRLAGGLVSKGRCACSPPRFRERGQRRRRLSARARARAHLFVARVPLQGLRLGAPVHGCCVWGGACFGSARARGSVERPERIPSAEVCVCECASLRASLCCVPCDHGTWTMSASGGVLLSRVGGGGRTSTARAAR